MTLVVVRHGIAEDAPPEGDDEARRLTPEGRAKMRRIASGMRVAGIRFDVLLASPLPRAAETAAIVSEAYGGTPAPRRLPALAPGTAPLDTLRALRPFARGGIAVVGHEPGLSGLIALLLTGSADGAAIVLKKGGAALLELETFAPRGAGLRALLTPRVLRRLGR